MFILNKFLYFVQKFITRRSQKKIKSIYFAWEFHKENLLKNKYPKVIEFGAGKDLRQNVYLSNFCGSQTVVDINKMLDIKLFNKYAHELSNLNNDIKFFNCRNIEDIDKFYNIKYLAPLNIDSSQFKEDQYDYCLSTDTLEHIPEQQIYDILIQVKRIIKKNGYLSFVIDYSDHYSHTDKNINPLNFLKFSELEWKKYNHQCHFQNRLRHSDFRKIFNDLKLELIKEEFEIYKYKINKIDKFFDIDEPLTFALNGTFFLKNIK